MSCPAQAGRTFDEATGKPIDGIGVPVSPVPAIIPDEMDQPQWQGYRSFLNRRFAPKAAEERRPLARAIARTLIDRVIDTGEFDIVGHLTNPLPALMTMQLFGFELDDWHDFAHPIHRYVYVPRDGAEFDEVIRGVEGIRIRIAEGAEDQRRAPKDDFLSYIADGEIDGRRMDDQEVIQMALNIIFAASILNSRLNFLRSIHVLQSDKHLISVSTKPAAGQ